jgi:rod shape-determining protein MreC
MRIFLFSHSVYKENIKLRKEIGLLRKEIIRSEELSKENERLKKMLSFKQKIPFTTTAARVVGRDSSNWISALIIDKGKKDGLEKDMPVINEVGLVGKIVEVGNATSKMLLINDPDLKVAGLIQESREEGIVSGTLNGKCKMYFLALTSEAVINNTVVTSGLGGIFPKGLLIGKIIDVYEDPSGLTKECLIEPAAKLSRLEEVLVILR